MSVDPVAGPRRRSMRIVPPAGETSIAFATRLSSTCSSRPATERTVTPGSTAATRTHRVLVGERAPRLDPAARRRRRRRPRPASPPARSARASSSSPSTRRESRATSASEPGDVGLGVAARGDLRLEVLEPEPQRGERRAQLVRRVGHELLLRGDQPLELAPRCR